MMKILSIETNYHKILNFNKRSKISVTIMTYNEYLRNNNSVKSS